MRKKGLCYFSSAVAACCFLCFMVLSALTMNAPTKLPTAMESRYSGMFVVNGIPKYVAIMVELVTPKALFMAQETAVPTMIEGMTRIGSARAKGIVPSVMPTMPMMMAVTPFSRSASV